MVEAVTANQRWLVVFGLIAAVALSACQRRPPQTAMFVVRANSAHAMDQVIQRTAQHLRFKVSHKDIQTPNGVAHDYEIYGGGVSVFVLQRMLDECPDKAGNYPPSRYDPSGYDALAGQTGLWRTQSFEDAMAGFIRVAREAGMEISTKSSVDEKLRQHCQSAAAA